MLTQCGRNIEPFDVATAAPSCDSEPMGCIKKNERTKAEPEEDISMKADSLGSEGDEEAEQADKSCAESGNRTIMRSPQAIVGGETTCGQSSTCHGDQQGQQGTGLMRLLQFSGILSSENPQKHRLSYWNDMIREYFTPGAVMSLTLWKDNQRIEANQFEVGVPVLPRFFLITTQSGVKSMSFSLDSARERIHETGHTIVECPGASWTYRYRSGYTVTLRGPLTAHIVRISGSLGGSHTGNNSDSMFKFDQLQFDGNFHDKFVALESILGSRSIENISPLTPMMMLTAPSSPVQTTAGIGPVGLSQSDQQSVDDKRSWEEPRVLINYASVPGEPVNAFGIPLAAFRCLELAKAVTTMTELIQFTKESSYGPLDALKKYATRLRESGDATPIGIEQQPQKRLVRKPVRKVTSRKRAKTDHSTNSSVTNGRKNLSLLLTMPLDILFEILGHLPPKDILSVSRASKNFRETLMTRSATTVWKAARNRLDVPDCPSWMSEPAWAALLFGHICQSCGTSNVHNVDFLLLKRVCALCKKTHLLIRSKATSSYLDILDFVPSTNAGFRGRPGSNYYYWDTDLEGMAKKLSKLEADVKSYLPNSQNRLFDFKEEQKERLTQIQQASPQWRSWFRAVQLERYKEKTEAQKRRVQQIKIKFRELGYTDDDIYIPWSQKEFRSTAPLTESSWKRIRPMLEPQAMIRKADRLRREESKIRCDRRNDIHLRYKDYQRTLHPSQWKYLPHTWEIIGYEPFARHVEAPVEVEVTAATFDGAFAHLPELLASAMDERKKSLRALLPSRFERIDASHDPMGLAIAAFRCEGDSAFLFGWDEIASHHCQEQEGYFDADVQPQATPPPVKYSGFAAIVVRKVAKLLGLDCATVTPADLDKEDLRFSCDICGSYKEGVDYYETGYNWRTLADHLYSSLHNMNLSIRVLSSGDIVEVQQCERNETWTAKKWTCTHCPEHLDNLQTRAVVLQHLHDSHAVEMPSEPTDFVFFERHRKSWTNPPRFTIYKTAEPAPLFRCLLCPRIIAFSNSSYYILPNIEAHLKKVHQVVDLEVGVNCEAIMSKVLAQPLSSVRTVRHID